MRLIAAYRFALIASLTALTVSAVRTQQTPTFSTGVKTVPVYATVTDRSGRFVLDLTKTDFTITDNGQPAPITQFSNQFVPITAAILVDLSRSMLPRYDAVIAAAEQFIVRLMPGDRARLGSFSEEVRMGPPLTGDRDALIALLHNNFNLQVGMRTRLWDAIEQGITTLDSVDGRRIVFVVTDGADTLSDATMDQALGHARKAGVIVYWISMNGTGGREQQARVRPDAGLLSFVQDTGGGYMRFAEIDEINRIMTEVTQELHHQYLLGFTPAALDGRVHKLDVSVSQPGATVRARKNYVAVNESAAATAPLDPRSTTVR